jgi:hypothetical protein
VPFHEEDNDSVESEQDHDDNDAYIPPPQCKT